MWIVVSILDKVTSELKPNTLSLVRRLHGTLFIFAPCLMGHNHSDQTKTFVNTHTPQLPHVPLSPQYNTTNIIIIIIIIIVLGFYKG